MQDDRRTAKSSKVLTIAAVLGVMAGVGAIYMTSAGPRNEGAAVCSGNTTIVERLKPLARGEVAGVVVPDSPRPVPQLAFKNAEGQDVTLADFKGRTVLLNLWATWCAPCRHEMPALNSLQAELGGEDFEVVAVSIDTQEPQKARDFLEELKIADLGFYADASARIFQELKMVGRAVGLPTTLLIDAEGCEIGYLPGPADWAADDAKALIGAAIAR